MLFPRALEVQLDERIQSRGNTTRNPMRSIVTIRVIHTALSLHPRWPS